MTGIGHRVAELFRAKANKVLTDAEDPRETLDYAYEQARTELTRARKGLADMATARQRVVDQDQTLARQEATLAGQAERAVNMGRDDLAREALTRQASIQEQRGPIQTQLAQLKTDQDNLEKLVRELEKRIQNMATQKEVLKAQFEAGTAATQVHESLTGIGTHMDDIGNAFTRAQERVQGVQARATALGGLVDSGALGSIPGIDSSDRLSSELNQLDLTGGVEGRLAALKAGRTSSRTTPRDEPQVAPSSDDGPFDFTKM